MKYEKIICGKFIDRPNRFVARVEISGKIHETHVKNTGRCRELLLPGAEVFLEDFSGRMGARRLIFPRSREEGDSAGKDYDKYGFTGAQ